MKALIFADGASSGNPGDSGIGIVIEIGDKIIEIAKYIGKATNNIAEYKSLIHALKKSLEQKADTIEVYMDSELVVKQVNGIYKVRSQNLSQLYKQVQSLLKRFKCYNIKYIPRTMNKRADSLAKEAIRSRAG